MNNLNLENAIFDMFCQHLDLRKSQMRRLAKVCSAVQSARNCYLSEIAKRLNRNIKPNSRVDYIRHSLMSPLFSIESIYHPLLKHALSFYQTTRWHITIDRSHLVDGKDLLMVSLSYRKRAIPIIWEIGQFGPTHHKNQIALLERTKPLIPANQSVLIHGDAEFGSVQMMKYVKK